MSDKIKDDGYVSVATKVPKHVAELLSILAKQRGMEVYELLQLLVNGFITAAKCEGPLPPEMRLMLEALKIDSAWCAAFNFASPTATLDIAQMVLVLQQRDLQGNPKHGFGLVMIDKPFLSEARRTLCVDDILERIAEVSMPGLYKELRQMGTSLDSQSLRETLTIMCDVQAVANLDEANRQEMPGYGEHHDYGKAIEYGQRTRQTKRRTPDDIARQTRIVFTDKDREVADYEVQDWEGEVRGERVSPEEIEQALGCKPFDVEP